MADNIIEIDLGDTLSSLKRVADGLENTRPLMRDLAEVLASGVEDNLARQAGPGGTPWADLAASTIEDRTREGKWPGQTLQRSGQLAASMQPFSGESEAGVSTNKKYAALHQFGGTDTMPPGPAAVPGRPYLYISADMDEELTDTLDEWADDALE